VTRSVGAMSAFFRMINIAASIICAIRFGSYCVGMASWSLGFGSWPDISRDMLFCACLLAVLAALRQLVDSLP